MRGPLGEHGSVKARFSRNGFHFQGNIDTNESGRNHFQLHVLLSIFPIKWAIQKFSGSSNIEIQAPGLVSTH